MKLYGTFPTISPMLRRSPDSEHFVRTLIQKYLLSMVQPYYFSLSLSPSPPPCPQRATRPRAINGRASTTRGGGRTLHLLPRKTNKKALPSSSSSSAAARSWCQTHASVLMRVHILLQCVTLLVNFFLLEKKIAVTEKLPKTPFNDDTPRYFFSNSCPRQNTGLKIAVWSFHTYSFWSKKITMGNSRYRAEGI